MTDDVPARVLEVLRDMLDAPALGPDDDFFAAGGSSLLVVRIIARLKQEGVRLTARTFIADSRVGAIMSAATPLPATSS